MNAAVDLCPPRAGRAGWRVNSERSGELPQAEFISAEDFKSTGTQTGHARFGNYGGPAKESVEKQIALIEEFVEARA